MKSQRSASYWAAGFFLSLFFLNGCATVPARSSPLPIWTPPKISPTAAYHTVRSGETVYRIAKNYGVTASELMHANRLYSPWRLEAGRSLLIPGKRLKPSVAPPTGGMNASQIAMLVGSKKFITPWRTLTIHHSGTRQGSAVLFDRDHKRRRMGGLFYHFVIGNGTYTPDGVIEVGWRWRKQVKANRPNDIQICLVGNFDDQEVSEAQMDSLTKLVSLLRKQYGISTANIRKHSDIKGKRTDCPGKHFPFNRFLRRLRELE